MPIHFKVSAGQTEDSSTHIQSWNQLCELVGRPDFLYVADSKLCTHPNLRHIDERGGGFIAMLPRGRREDTLFRKWLITASPSWEPIAERPHPRLRHGPRCRYHTRKGVTDCIDTILASTQTAAYITYEVRCEQEIRYRTVQRGEVSRKYRTGSRKRFVITWQSDPSALQAAAKTDGVFPLITNRRDLSALQIFTAYRCKQPLVEQRHDLLKNVLSATPVYLKNIGRLEALLFLEFIALMVHALIERQLRWAMQDAGENTLPLYPEERPCKAPTTARLIELFQMVQFHRLRDSDSVLQQFPPQLSETQMTMIRFAGLQPGAYSCVGLQQTLATET